jgi:uncharacterized protein (DUF2461 family)
MSYTIEPQFFEFINELKLNNNREWFSDHKNRFKSLEKKFKTEVENLLLKMQQHDDIESSKVFRIYRDVRFSKTNNLIKHILVPPL